MTMLVKYLVLLCNVQCHAMMRSQQNAMQSFV